MEATRKIVKLTMLGTGTGLIRPERRSPAVLLQATAGESVIIDCGWGVPGAVNEIGFPLHTATHVTISHRHADHIAALPALLQSQMIANIKHLPGEARQDKLLVHGYPGITHDISVLCEMMNPELDMQKDLVIVEHGYGEHHRYGNLTISAVLVRHVQTMPAVSFCFEAEGKKVIVTGDLRWDETVIPQLQDADLVIVDSSATQQEYQEHPDRSHLAPIECGQMAARANVKHVVLTSLYDRESPEAIMTAVRQHYDGTLTIPHDLQVFEL